MEQPLAMTASKAIAAQVKTSWFPESRNMWIADTAAPGRWVPGKSTCRQIPRDKKQRIVETILHNIETDCRVIIFKD